MYAVSLSHTSVLEIGVLLTDEAEELDWFYIKCIVKFKKIEVLSLFNCKKSDDLDFNYLNRLTNLRLVNHWQRHSEFVQFYTAKPTPLSFPNRNVSYKTYMN